MRTIIIGVGGQARVIIDILMFDRNIEVIGLIDKTLTKGEKVNKVPILGTFSEISKICKCNDVEGFIVGVGDNYIRAKYYEALKNMGLKPINAIHPSASITHNVKMGKGNVICMGSVVCTYAKIGNNCIINTGAIVEHECKVKDHAHISSGTNIAGRVTIGKGSFIGIGTTIIQNLKID